MERIHAFAGLLVVFLACCAGSSPAHAQIDNRRGYVLPPIGADRGDNSAGKDRDRGKAKPDDRPGPVTTPSAVKHADPPPANLLPIDLPYALRLVNTSNPTIALAQQRVAEAYAVQMQADVLWIPNLWVGGNPHAPAFLPTFYHHDGEIQNAQGLVTTTTKNNFFLQAGASLEVSTADAFFGPRVTRNAVTAAQQHARAVSQNIQLDVALAYLDLLRAYGALAINFEALQKAEAMQRYAESAFRQGLGKTGADPNRARTEVEFRRQERFRMQEEVAVASARLTQLLLVDPTVDLIPADQTVLPLVLVDTDCNLDELLAVAVVNRPELAEDQALIRAALARWRQEKFRPLFPILQAFYYNGSFVGGKVGSTTGPLGVAGAREDVLAQVSWELRNFGLGNWAAAREQGARYRAAQFHLVETQARVAAEVVAFAKIVRQRQQTLRASQSGVRNAEEMWRKLEWVRFGIGLPARKYDALEPLLAERALFDARMVYLDNVIEYNRAQFRLYWAMGQPPEKAVPGSPTLPLETSVHPPPYTPSMPVKGRDKDEVLPPPRVVPPLK
jgi:outer membrane protein TolC